MHAVDLGVERCAFCRRAARRLRHAARLRQITAASAPPAGDRTPVRIIETVSEIALHPEDNRGGAVRHSGFDVGVADDLRRFRHFGSDPRGKFAGVPLIGSNPMGKTFCCTSAARSPSWFRGEGGRSPPWARPWGRGCPAACRSSWSATPASAIVGTSGHRDAALGAGHREPGEVRLSSICGAAGGIEENAIGVWLPITD